MGLEDNKNFLGLGNEDVLSDNDSGRMSNVSGGAMSCRNIASLKSGIIDREGGLSHISKAKKANGTMKTESNHHIPVNFKTGGGTVTHAGSLHATRDGAIASQGGSITNEKIVKTKIDRSSITPEIKTKDGSLTTPKIVKKYIENGATQKTSNKIVKTKIDRTTVGSPDKKDSVRGSKSAPAIVKTRIGTGEKIID